MKSHYVPNDQRRSEAPRKAYNKPHVQVHGDLKALTQGSFSNNAMDSQQGSGKTS